MYLSNQHRYFLILILTASIFQSCSSNPSGINANANVGDLKSEFPFATKEPEQYQGNFVVSIGTNEEVFFRARKGERSRIDIYNNGAVSTTRLVTDKTYIIDHLRKIYTDEAMIVGDIITAAAFDTTNGFFAGKEYIKFEEVSSDGKFTEYRVSGSNPTKREAKVTVDRLSGLMVRQEFIEQNDSAQQKIIFEIRDLKFEVDDSIFQFPAGFRRVEKDEFNLQRSKNGK